MTNSNRSHSSPGNLNVAENETAIYEDGQLISISIEDIKGNEIAVRQLINNLNLANRQKRNLKDEVQQLKSERAERTLQPVVTMIATVVNACSIAVVGLSTSYLSADTPPEGAGWLLFVGIVLAVLSSLVNPLLPLLINLIKQFKSNATK